MGIIKIDVELAKVLAEVRQERLRQDQKWGQQNHLPAEWLAILGEEFGEVSKEVLRNRFGGRELDNYRVELIQVAAVAVAMVECLDRDRWWKEQATQSP